MNRLHEMERCAIVAGMATTPDTTTPGWSARAIDAALTTLTGRPVDRATIAEALRAADTRRRAETDATNPGPRPRSVEVHARWGAARERVPGGNGRDWTADSAELAEMVTRAQTMVDDPTNRYDDWRVITHGPGTPERAAYVAQVLADLEASARATARAIKDTCPCDPYGPAIAEDRPECDPSLALLCADCLADHVRDCGICQAVERDHLDAEDDR